MRTLAAFAVLLLVAACQTAPPPEMTEAEIAQIEAEATQAITDRLSDMGRYNPIEHFDAWSDLFTPDVRVLGPGTDRSGNAWFESVRGLADTGVEFLNLDVEPFETFVHGDVAYQIGQWDQTMAIPSGETVENHVYFFARLERGTDGVWRLNRILSAPRAAPAEG